MVYANAVIFPYKTQEFTIKEACTNGEQEDVERCQLEDAYGYRYHKGYPQET